MNVDLQCWRWMSWLIIIWFYFQLIIMQNISMPKLQKQQLQGDQQKLLIKSIFMKVKFTCRCYFEYQINQQVLRTKQIKVDSKNTHYEFNQCIRLPNSQTKPTSKPQSLRIAVKLLSNKGLSFTVGFIDITPQNISRGGCAFEVKVYQTQDIQARCIFELIKPAVSNEYKTPKKQAADANILSNENINETYSSKSKSSRLEMEFEQLKEDYYKLKDKFSKYQESNGVQLNQKYPLHEPKITQYENKRTNESIQQQRQKNELLQLRIKELERELAHNHQLFNKQKDILKIFEANLKQKHSQYEQLRKKYNQLSIKCDELYKSNCILEEQKIHYLMEQLKNEKQKNTIGEYMAHMFEQVYKVIQNIFKQRISNLTSIVQSKQLSKNEAKKQTLTSPTSPIKKLFYSTDFKKCQQAAEVCIAEDVSISGDLSVSQIKSMNIVNGEIVMKNILKDFQPRVSSLFSQQCIETVKTYCFKIQKIVNQSVQKMFKKIMELTSYNQAYKKQLNEEKQEFENNQQSLIDYLEQLEDGLETQLEIVKEKDLMLQREEGIIHTLNELLLQKQRRICELEEAYEKLEDEKNEIKTELHENNYMFSMKEEQLMKKIYELETGFEKPQYHQLQQQPARLNIIQRKQTVVSDNYDEQIQNIHQEFDDFYQSEVIYESPKIDRQKDQNQIVHPEQNQFCYYQDSDEVNLRHTMLKNHRLSLVKKLREQMANAENAESIDEDDQQHEEEEKVIEQEFLKVLV